MMLGMKLGKRGPLDDVLGHFAKGDPLMVRDMTKSACVFGQTGSGKSSGSGLMMARSIVSYQNSGGLVLASKPEDKDFWLKVFADARRPDDLLIMEPGGKNRCNALDFKMKRGADTRELTQFIMTMKDTIIRSKGVGNDQFWDQMNLMQIYNGLEICIRATGRADPWDLKRFIDGAANGPEELKTPEFAAGFHGQTMLAARARLTDDIQAHDYKQAEQYFCGKLPRLDPKTRSNIGAGVDGILHTYNVGTVRHLLATETTVSPEVMQQRKWILVNMPVVAGDASATFVNAAMKYITQWYVLKRAATTADPIIGIFCDEFPKVVNEYDAAFLAESRSHKGFMIFLMQSLPGLIASLGQGGKERAEALLSCAYLKFFHVLGDAATANYASSLLGQELRTVAGGNASPSNGIGEELFGRSSMSSSFNQQWEPILQPNCFMTGLRTGGKPNGYKVDGILIREGYYRYVSFDQRS